MGKGMGLGGWVGREFAIGDFWVLEVFLDGRIWIGFSGC